MTFKLSLSCPPVLTRLSTVDDQVDDLVTLAIEGCALLAKAGCRFRAGGFGDDEWPVDEWDLSSVIQQLPDVLALLRAGSESTLDFFEQGMQRRLEISPVGDFVEIRCRSGTSWVPDPALELVSTRQLDSMLVALAQSFASTLGLLGPRLAGSLPLPAWRRGEV